MVDFYRFQIHKISFAQVKIDAIFDNTRQIDPSFDDILRKSMGNKKKKIK
jgi:hypothetical protein